MSRIATTTPPDDAVMPNRHLKAPAVGSQIPSHFGHCFGCGELHQSGLHLVARSAPASPAFAYDGSGISGSSLLIKTSFMD